MASRSTGPASRPAWPNADDPYRSYYRRLDGGTRCRRLSARRSIISVAVGQVLSLLIAGTAITSSMLASRSISIPTTQSALNYALLSFYLCLRKRGPLKVAWWRYAVQALVDVEANYLVVLAYRYTSITSVTLLDCFAIPCAMLLSYCVLASRYTKLHLVGVAVCLTGLGCTVLSDMIAVRRTGQQVEYPNALLGDICCLLGASLYAASNVMQEALVKAHDPVEFLGMLGIMGTAISMIQAAILEWPQLHSLSWSGATLGIMAAFAAFLFTMYSLTALFLTESDATLFNLSLLTSDVYAVLYRIRFLHSKVNALYLVAYGCTSVGLGLYSIAAPVNLSAEDELQDDGGAVPALLEQDVDSDSTNVH